MSEGVFEEISEAIQSFEEEKVFNAVKKALSLGVDPTEIIEKGIARGLKIVGDKYERGELFLMHLVAAAEPAQKVVKELLEPEIKKRAGERKSLGKVVIGTVQGDIHDIGKNIVAAMLFAAGFEVYDLGKDVPAEEFAKKAKELNANIVGASALLSTTLPVQKEIIEALKAMGIRDKVKTIFGGAPCTAEWVEEIGGDGYAENAIEAVKVAKRLIGVKD
ncbi:MAG: corrinoid protein [Candidatus Bathyarchaeia archaeon]|nr:corrinoid protein [Candidatus Bathyarchaeota archaeon]